MLLHNLKENVTNLCRRRTCLDVKNLCLPITEENPDEAHPSEDKSDSKYVSKTSHDHRSGCWNDMLKKLTRKRRLSLKGTEMKLDVERLYPSRTFMIKKPIFG